MIQKLEEINHDMAKEVQHFEEEFVSKTNLENRNTDNDELKQESNENDKKSNRSPKTLRGDTPLEDISTPKKSQPNLQMFQFHKNVKDSHDGKVDEIKKAQEDFVKKKGIDMFVSGISINLLKVESGTFAKMDDGTAGKIEGTPITLPDKNPNYVGQKLEQDTAKLKVSKLNKDEVQDLVNDLENDEQIIKNNDTNAQDNKNTSNHNEETEKKQMKNNHQEMTMIHKIFQFVTKMMNLLESKKIQK